MALLTIILVILSGIIGAVLVFVIGCALVLAWAMYGFDEEIFDDTHDADDYPVRP